MHKLADVEERNVSSQQTAIAFDIGRTIAIGSAVAVAAALALLFVVSLSSRGLTPTRIEVPARILPEKIAAPPLKSDTVMPIDLEALALLLARSEVGRDTIDNKRLQLWRGLVSRLALVCSANRPEELGAVITVGHEELNKYDPIGLMGVANGLSVLASAGVVAGATHIDCRRVLEAWIRQVKKGAT